MNALNATPGPWVTERGNSIIKIFGGNRVIAASATKAYWERADETDEANAHLIAAAPELYEALDDARMFIELVRMRAAQEGDVDQAAEAAASLNSALAALAKARGEA